jgi:hypothetical protein
MHRFIELGFVDYSDNGGLTVHSGLLSVILRLISMFNVRYQAPR